MDKRLSMGKYFHILAICLIGILLSCLGYWNSTHIESQRQQAIVSKLINERQALLENRLAITVEILDTVGRFIANEKTLSPSGYRFFTLPILDRHKEFWALHWVPKVRHDNRELFEKALQERGFPEGIKALQPASNTLLSSGVKSVYFPVQLTEPLQRNREVIGFDVSSREINNQGIEQTLNENIEFLASPPFKLVQDNEGSLSVVFYRPVFSVFPAPSDPQLRQQALRGYVVALVKPQAILDHLSDYDSAMAVGLSDVVAGVSTLMASKNRSQIDADWLMRQVTFSSLSREWQLDLAVSLEHPLLMNKSNRALWVLIGGLCFTAVLALILLRLAQAHLQISLERDRAQNYLDTVETMMMVLDVNGRVTMMNRKGYEILDYHPPELLGCLWFSPQFIPDPSTNFAVFLKSVEAGELPEDWVYTENPAIDKQGNQLMIAWHHKIQRDINGVVTGMLSAGEDITQKHYFTSMESIRSRAMQQVLEGSPLEAVLDQVLTGIEALNPGTQCSILLLDETGKHLRSCSGPSLPTAYNEAIDGVEIGDGVGSCGTAAFRKERIIVEDIQQHPYWSEFKELAALHQLGSCWSQPIFGRKGRLLGTFAIYHASATVPIQRDLDLIMRTADFVSLLIEEQQTEADLKRLASTDELTALPNRRAFLVALGAEYARAKRYNRQLSICMLDLDHFKQVNDRYGHHTGDIVLREVASVMRDILREADMAGRLGGEEFGILLPDTLESDAMIMAERLRAAIEKHEVLNQEQILQVTASIGVTSFQLNTESDRTSDLLSVADRCLYYAKQNGRNQVSNTPTDLHAS